MSKMSRGSCTLMAHSIAQKAKTPQRAGSLVGSCAQAMLSSNETVRVCFTGFDEVPDEFIKGFVYAVADVSPKSLGKLKLEDVPDESLTLFKKLYREARASL